MAADYEEVTIYTCDAGCGKQTIQRPGDLVEGILLPEVYRNTGKETTTATDVYACSVAHLRKAVEKATQAAYDKAHPYTGQDADGEKPSAAGVEPDPHGLVGDEDSDGGVAG